MPTVVIGSMLIASSCRSATAQHCPNELGLTFNTLREMSGCPLGAFCAGRRGAWSRHWHGRAIPEPWRCRPRRRGRSSPSWRPASAHKTIDLSADAGRKAVFLPDIAIDRAGIERPIELAGDVVLHVTEETPTASLPWPASAKYSSIKDRAGLEALPATIRVNVTPPSALH
jgi:hypothetical protein